MLEGLLCRSVVEHDVFQVKALLCVGGHTFGVERSRPPVGT
jgi:hypothetical protein